MDIKALRRDMAAIGGGRWVDKTEVPELQDLRVKIKGTQTQAIRDKLGELQRSGVDTGEAMQSIIAEDCLIEIQGLTSGGKEITADDIRGELSDPAWEPLGILLLQCVRVVDATREIHEKAVEKN